MIRALLLLLCASMGTKAATFNAATASRTDVNAAIALTSPGDTVVVPANAGVSWAGDITITGITLQGPGKDEASPCVITAGKVTLTKHATAITKMIGFRFTANAQDFLVGGSSANKMFVIGDCYFANGGAVLFSITCNGGLLYSNLFIAATPHSADTCAINLGGTGTDGETSWQAAHSMGTADVNGDKNIYFEDCRWEGFLEASFDADNGARVVVRHCTFADSSTGHHGGGSGSSGNDTSSYGNRHVEFYNNVFDRVSNAAALNKWVWWRGSSGVFVSNSVEDASSPDGSSFPNKPEIRLSVGCPGAYPRQYQVGQSTQTADGTPDNPLIIWQNTGAGTASGNFIVIAENPNDACGTPTDYIQSGRDYVTSNTWGWVPYRYPHPLNPKSGAQGGGGGSEHKLARKQGQNIAGRRR